MEVLPNDKILEFLPDSLEAVRKLYGLDQPGAMKDAVDILDNWIQKQNHFTKKKFNRDYLERLIIVNKGSVERTKARLDRLFTIRTLMPDFFKDYDARNDFESIQNVVTMVLLPKMTKDYDRVCLIKVSGKNFSTKALHDSNRFSLLLMEYSRGHDYARSNYVVIDYLDVGFTELLAAFDLMDFRQIVVALMDGYGLRVKGIHLMVNSKVIDIVLSIAKQVLSEKLKKRVHIHKTYDELYEHVPREIFPQDLGGEETPLTDIHAKMMEVFCTEEYGEYWRDMNSARTDESLRQVDTFNDQYMGMPGTFRSLSVD